MADTLGLQDDSADPVIEAYKKHIDRTLFRENLKKSHEERILALQHVLEVVKEVQRAGRAMRERQQ